MRSIEILQQAGEAAGLPPDALQVIPDPTLDISQYLFHHPGVDFIWTTGGPKAVQATNEAGKPCMGVGSGNAPVYVHGSADVPMAVVAEEVAHTPEQLLADLLGFLERAPGELGLVLEDAATNDLVDPLLVDVELAQLVGEVDGVPAVIGHQPGAVLERDQHTLARRHRPHGCIHR